MEHGSFTQQEVTAFNQLVRVVVRDFLPFVKRIFTSLFSETAVEQLALSTPYTLRHGKKAPPTSAPGSDSGGVQLVTTILTGRPGVELGMDLNMDSIAEPLRKIASDVFEELENLKQQQFTAATGIDSKLHEEEGAINSSSPGILEASQAEQKQREEKEVKESEGEGGNKDDGVENEIELLRNKTLQDGDRAEMQVQQEAKFESKQQLDMIGHRSQESDHTVTINSIGSINSGGSQLLAGAYPSLVGQLPSSLALGQSEAAARTITANVIHHHTLPLAKDKAV